MSITLGGQRTRELARIAEFDPHEGDRAGHVVTIDAVLRASAPDDKLPPAARQNVCREGCRNARF